MDLMNLLRSIEALLYEIVSWLLFYPLTLWRCLRHPLRMMIYAERELTDLPEKQFDDVLSPPLFLFLTLIIAHIIELQIGMEPHGLSGALQDERNLLIFRAVLFSLFPLLVGIQRVRQLGQRLTRATLRPAFYSQCYLAAPFVLMVDLGMLVGRLPQERASVVGMFIFLAGLAWYLSSLTAWFVQHGKTSRFQALVRAFGTVLIGAIIVISAAYLIAYPSS